MSRPALLSAALILSLTHCGGEVDLREVKHERTRNADGITQLYKNPRQGNWTLKGKVILVRGAIVTGIQTRSGRVVVDLAGFDELAPLSLRCTFHQSQTRRARSIQQGDVIAFKAICDGLDRVVLFSSGVLLSVDRPVT